MPQIHPLPSRASHQQDSKNSALSRFLALGLGVAAVGMSAQSALAQNVTDQYTATTATDWSVGTSWSLGTPPVSNNDVLFTTGGAATSTITAENFNIGSFNSTIAEAVTNASTTTASILTLGGGSATTDQVSGSNAADLIYVTANTSLGLTAATGNLNVVLGQAGRLDAVGGTLTIGLATGTDTFSLGGFTLTATGTSQIQINSVVSDGSTTSAGSILKTGTNTFVLNTANTYTGTTTIENGVLNGGNATSFGNTTSAIALGDATSITSNLSPTLTVGGTNTIIARNITVGASNATTTGVYKIGSTNNSQPTTINGTVTLNQGLTVISSNAAFNLQGSVTSGSTGTQTLNLSPAGSGAQAVSTVIGGGTGTVAVTKAGAGVGIVTLSGANTYTGATTVTTGTLQAGSTTAFGVNSAVTLANTANVVLALNNNSVTIGSLTGGGTTGGNVTLGTGTLSIGSDNTTPAAYAGVISGTGGLTKVGTGTAPLSGTNTYTGTTTIENGVLNPAVAGALGSATSAIALGDATSITSNLSPSLLVSGVTTIARNITVGASNGTTTGTYTIGSGNAGSAAQINGTVTLNQNVTVASAGATFTLAGSVTSGSTGTQTVTLNNTGAQTDTTVIGGGTGTIALVKAGAGNATLSGANTYTGITTVNAGILTVASGGTLGSGAVTVNSGGSLVTSGTGTLGSGTSVTVAGTGALTLGNSTSLSSSQTLNFAGTSTINLNNTSTDTVANIVDTDGTSTFTPVPGTTYAATALDADFGVNSFTGSGSLTIAAVPEPTTWIGGLMSVGALGFALRRRMGTRLI